MRPAIILIHGYGFDSASWDPVVPVLEAYKIVRFSLPGFEGASSGEEIDNYSIAQLSARFWEAIDPATFPEVHLVGHSMGGYVCMEMLAQQPDRVLSLGLIHSHVFADSLEKKAQRTATAEEILASGRNGFVHRFYPPLFFNITAGDPLMKQLEARGMQFPDSAWIQGALAMRDRKDHSDTLRRAQIPVLMIMGDKDRAVPLEWIYSQAVLPERNSLHIYHDVGHMSMYEWPEKLREDVGLFYRVFL